MEKQSDFYSSLIRATKTYVGNDPLLPWLEGIDKIKEVLPPEVAKQKLPRFMEKCAQTFLTDTRYKNDLRYLQVWIQLLEFVPNRREALLAMENNQIGLKHALYYQAYALHYEKLKKFPEADAMFRLGIQRFANPTENLHKSYGAFLERMASRNRRKLKSLRARAELRSENIHSEHTHFVVNADVSIKEVGNEMEVYPKGEYQFEANSSLNHLLEICNNVEKSSPTWNSIAESASHPELDEGDHSASSFPSTSCSEDTITVRKFVDSAVCYAEKVEDAYHHGLVEPTINTKEAMADINDMFGKPLNFERSIIGNQLWRRKTNKPVENFQVLVDEDLKESGSTEQCLLPDTSVGHISISPFSKDLQIFVDEDLMHSSSKEVQSITNSCKNFAPVNGLQILADNSVNENQNVIFMQRNTGENGELSTAAEIFHDRLTTEVKWDKNMSHVERKKSYGQLGNAEEVSMQSQFSGEDTIAIRKFVDSAIDGGSKELEVACHHGLVDPTINTKEAMEEINNMFWKPLEFDKLKERTRPPRVEIVKQPTETFQIFADENLEEQDSCISPSKDFEVFIDENLMNDSLKELPRKLSSSVNLTPFQGLQILSDESLENKTSKECNIFKDKRPYVPVEVFQDMQVSPKVSLPPNFSSEDTMIIRKFVDSAIVGTEVEDACHHGLVDPTINTKEAMAEINNMFGKPLDFHNTKRSCALKPEKSTQSVKSSSISVNEDIEKHSLKQQHVPNNLDHDSAIPRDKGFQIFIDGDVHCESTNNHTKKSCLSKEIACGPILTNESSVVLQEKASTECCVSENENVCKPAEGFQVYIDEQFQD